ncbi:MAG: TRAP transporter substrate-binding protein [Alphaproteobacteria bacterium]|nr:TRAP transporter substrate-binding protein [Alphaproteobacteria bacterium]
MKRLFIQTVLAVAALSALGVAQAQEKTIKFATQNPKGHPIVVGLEKFKEIVEAKSAGKIKVNLFPGGALGSDQVNVAALQGGTLEMVSMNSGILANQVKEFAIFDFPFMFGSGAEADAVLDGVFGKKMHALLNDKGLIGLSYFELGFRQITNSKRPITKVEDLEGLKLRVIPNPINVDWVKALGANPTPLPFPEVYSALDQKAIDGQENPESVIAANKFFEVQKHLVISNHQYNPQSVLISKKFWDGLTPAQQKLIAQSALEASKYQRTQARGAVASALDTLKKNGIQVTSFSEVELAKLRDKLRPVTAKYGVTVGQDLVKELQGDLEKARSDLKKK